MAYHTFHWRGCHYIRGEEDDPKPRVIGPFRVQSQAERCAKELNDELKQDKQTKEGPSNGR